MRVISRLNSYRKIRKAEDVIKEENCTVGSRLLALYLMRKLRILYCTIKVKKDNGKVA